jgi:hypothetical protein
MFKPLNKVTTKYIATLFVLDTYMLQELVSVTFKFQSVYIILCIVLCGMFDCRTACPVHGSVSNFIYLIFSDCSSLVAFLL